MSYYKNFSNTQKRKDIILGTCFRWQITRIDNDALQLPFHLSSYSLWKCLLKIFLDCILNSEITERQRKLNNNLKTLPNVCLFTQLHSESFFIEHNMIFLCLNILFVYNYGSKTFIYLCFIDCTRPHASRQCVCV